LSNEPAVLVEGVSKHFVWRGADVQALSDVSLEVRRGEVFALLGPNGAGKSTLLHVLLGILIPDRGEVSVLGRDVLASGPPYGCIGFASPEAKFHWALTVRDALSLYGMAYGVRGAERRRRVSELIAEFGLEDAADRKFDLLSTGEKMRAILAKALVNAPSLLILDEPTVGLDPDGAILIRREISRLNRERGLTVLLTSHYMREVEELAHRIAFMSRGRIADAGPAREVVARAMPGRTVVTVSRAPETAAGALAGMGFERKGERWVRAGPGDERLARVLKDLGDLGLGAGDFEIGQPSLEDYFLHMAARPDEGERREGRS
jgi:ABC-2 type transport system ATP-binding protein